MRRRNGGGSTSLAGGSVLLSFPHLFLCVVLERSEESRIFDARSRASILISPSPLNSLSLCRERVRVRDNCAAQLSDAPHIRHIANQKIGESHSARASLPAKSHPA